MRRLAVCAFVVLAAGLVLAPGALASTGVRHAALGAGHTPRVGAAFALGDGATYNISGHVLNFDGSAAAGAEVDWGWWDTSGNYNFVDDNLTMTDDAGAFAFPGVTSNAANRANSDDLTAWYQYPSPLVQLDFWNNDFSVNNDQTTPTAYSYELRPGAVPVTFTGLSTALANGQPEIWVAGTSGFAETSTQLTGGNGTASVAPPSFDDVSAGFYTAQGGMTAETQSQGVDESVAAGATYPTAVSLDWTQARHAYLAGPVCQHSGKPGTKVKLVLKGWPTGQQASFSIAGSSLYKDYSNVFTSAGATYTASLKIPTAASPDMYQIHAWRSDDQWGFPDLWDVYQTCTFKASASAIRNGGTVRLSGTVWGYGKATVYARSKASGQPATTAAKGWVRVGRYTINKYGKFASGLLHPKHTTWYVTRYAGYDFTAFTSVIKVTVH